MVTTEKFIRKPFTIDAVRVTEENLEEVAKWCGGDVTTETRGKKEVRYIKVPVTNPLNERQTKAYVGDWVLHSKSSWKSYTNRAFDDSFEQYSPTPVQKEALFELKDKVNSTRQ
jgi:hypothetical protein